MKTEKLILKNLIHNEEFTKKVSPFLKPEYFSNSVELLFFNTITEFIQKYKKNPSIDSLEIDIFNKKLQENLLEEIKETIEELRVDSPVDLDWLLDTTENFCKDKAIYLALMESIDIADGMSKKYTKDAIPDLLQKALAVSFDSSVGHDYFGDIEARYDAITSQALKFPFDIDMLNTITDGGVESKTLNVIMAGCVHPDTMVNAFWLRSDQSLGLFRNIPIKQVKISYIERLLERNYQVWVDSPDGYVKVSQFVDKGMWPCYRLSLMDGRTVDCNENHLFETTMGWRFAKDLVGLGEQHFLTNEGLVLGDVDFLEYEIPIVDITVEHENHRYYTNGVSSHNTGVGKTIWMCHLAAMYISQGLDVLYLTMEMAEHKIANRIDANLLNIQLNNFKNLPKDIYLSKFQKIQSKTNGRLFIKQYPNGGAHVGHFGMLLNELYLKKRFRPKIVMVDYLGICASSRIKLGGSINSYQYQKSIAEEVRGFAVEEDLVAWSGAQFNRAGYGNSDVDMTNTSESMGLPYTCDLFAAFISTDQLKENNQIMFKQLKNRYGDVDMNNKFIIGLDKSRMKFFNADHAPRNVDLDQVEAEGDPDSGFVDVFNSGGINKKSRRSSSGILI